jgi:putative peptidoglycan lipid II flippase
MTTTPATDVAPRARPRRASLGRSTAIFALWTAVSRAAGLVREIISAAIFGTQGAINAFVIAYQLPGLLRNLVADSALAAAFVPVFTELQERGRHRDAQRLAGALLGLAMAGLGAISALAVVVAPWIVPPLAPGLSPELADTAVTLAQIMFPVVALFGLSGVVEAILQAGGRFGPSAFAPVLWNAVIIGCLIGLTPRVPEDDRIEVYAGGIVLGTLAQVLFLVPWLRGLGPFPLSLRVRVPGVLRVLALMVPVTLGLGLISVNLTVDSLFATLVSDRAPRAIDAAFRIYLLPQGIFSVAVATVLFPTIARQAARADWEGMRSTIASGVRAIAFVLLPASAFLMVLAEPIVRLVFERGEFDAVSTALTGEALLFFTIGLAFNGASLLLIRSFFALQQSWLPTKVALFGVALNAGLDAALYQPLGVAGIPLATSISSASTCLILVVLLQRRIGGLHVRSIVAAVVRIALFSAVAALLGWTIWTALDQSVGDSLAGQVVSVSLAAAGAAVAYLVAAWIFKADELSTFARANERRPGAQGGALRADDPHRTRGADAPMEDRKALSEAPTGERAVMYRQAAVAARDARRFALALFLQRRISWRQYRRWCRNARADLRAAHRELSRGEGHERPGPGPTES